MKYSKQIIFLISGFLIIHNCFSQTKNGINLNFNWSYIGKNTEISYMRSLKKHSFYGGIKYHLNFPITDNQNNVTKNRYYADSFFEHFGLIAGYEYKFNIKNSDITPFIFYNIQYSKSRIYDYNIIMPYDYDSNSGNILYKKYPDIYTDPLPVVDNTIGIGLRFKLFKNLFLSAKAGLGVGFFYFDSSTPYSYGASYWTWEVTTFFNIGLTYYLK